MTSPDSDLPDFLILTPGRAGSEYLVSLLDTHDHLQCRGEIMGIGAIAPGQPDEALEQVRAVVRRFRDGPRDSRFGFKLPVTCVLEDSTLVGDLQQRGTRVVILARENRLAMYVSMRLAQINNNWRSRSPYAVTRLTIEPAELQAFIRGTFGLDDRMAQLAAGGEHLAISYESLCADANVPTVQAFLGVPFQPLHAATRRGRTASLAETIENYDEVVAVLQRMDCHHFIEP